VIGSLCFGQAAGRRWVAARQPFADKAWRPITPPASVAAWLPGCYNQTATTMLLLPTYPAQGYAIAFTISFWSWLLFEIWVFSRDRGKEKAGSRSSGLWPFLALVVGITLALNLPALAPAFDVRKGFAVFFLIGIALIWAGLLFRFWSIQTLGKFFSTRLIIQQGHELITTGPYRRLRNPSYTGALATFIGIGFAVSNWLSIAVMLCAGLFLYVGRIRVEEKMLQDQFGPVFDEYKQHTWALIPFIW
jgi:protein-S-isoprenylcysteine O-methyltransferase